MRSLFLLAVLSAAACAKRFPGSSAVPAATEFKPAASNSNALAARVTATANQPTLIHDAALDEVALLIADEFPNGLETPGPLYLRELFWRRGIIGNYENLTVFRNWDKSLRRQRMEQHLTNIVETRKLEKRCFGVSFNSNPSPSVVAMVWGRCWVDVKPFPAFFAGGETFTLEGKVRHERAMAVRVYVPGERAPREVNLAEDGSWPPIEIHVPQTPGRYFLEVTPSTETDALLFVPITVGPLSPVEPIDVQPPSSPEGLEAALRSVMNQHRTRAGLSPLAADAKVDAMLRNKLGKESEANALTAEEEGSLGYTRATLWARRWGGREGDERALIEAMRPSFAATASDEGELLVVAARDLGEDGWAVSLEILKKK